MWGKVIGWKGGWKMSLWRTKYWEELEEKTDKDALLEKRLEKCGNLCQLGIANLFWKGTTLVFKDMQAKKDPYLFYSIASFTFCLLCMVTGTIAAMFPDTSPAPCFLSGLGALMAIVSMIGSYHLDLLAYFPSDLSCYTSMALTSATLTVYWAYAVQDPWIIHLVARLLNVLWDLLVYMWGKVIGWKGGWKTSLCRTTYFEELKEKPDKDALLEKRLEKCGNLCQLGIANLFWKGTTLVFKDMQAKKDPYLFYSIASFTFCLLCMVMGIIAAMFPDTAPAPCFMSGLGAHMAIVSMIGAYHLDLLAYFPSDLNCYTSMALTSATLAVFWAYAVQDPWIIHLLARLLNVLWDLLVYMWGKVIGWKGGWKGKGDAAMKKMKDFCGSRKGNKQDSKNPLLGRNR